MAHESHPIVPGDEGVAESRDRRRARTTPCPLCRREVGAREMVEATVHLDPHTTGLVAANAPGWQPSDGLCADCARRFTAALAYLRQHFPRLLSSGHPILPTAVRLGASDR